MLIAEDASIRPHREDDDAVSIIDDDNKNNTAVEQQNSPLSRFVYPDDVSLSREHRSVCLQSGNGIRGRCCIGERAASTMLSSDDDSLRRCESHEDVNQLRHTLADCDVHTPGLQLQESAWADTASWRPSSCPCLSTAHTLTACQRSTGDDRRYLGATVRDDEVRELERWWHESANRHRRHRRQRLPVQQQQQQVIQYPSNSHLSGTPVDSERCVRITDQSGTPEVVDAVTVAVESLASSHAMPPCDWSDPRLRRISERSPQRRIEVRRRCPRRCALFFTPVGVLTVLCFIMALASVVSGIGVCTSYTDDALGYVLLGELFVEPPYIQDNN
jgi:hypothetical protein